MAPNMKDAQVLAAGISYFSVEQMMGPDGQPMIGNNNREITSTLRHEAMHGDVVSMSEYEFNRLAKMGAVREPSTAPTRPAQTATPFGVPMPSAADPDAPPEAFRGPIMGDPHPSAGATDLEISRAQVAGALTPEESKRLQEAALVGRNDDSAEAIADRDYEAATVKALQTEIERRNAGRDAEAQIKPEGTGSNGNVIKEDLEMALVADDEAQDTE